MKTIIVALILCAGIASAEEQTVLTNSRGERYHPGTPTYVPLIDDCLALGGTRPDCIEALPPDELKKLEAEEARRGAMRRAQLRARRGHEVFGGRVLRSDQSLPPTL